MFFAANVDLTRWWPRPGEGPVEYWTSLSPMAPFFGVQWRFAEQDSGRPAPRRAAAPKRSLIRKDAVDAEVVAPKAAAKPAAKAAPKAEAAKPEPVKAATVKATPAPAKPEPVKPVAVKPEPVKAEAPKAEAPKAAPKVAAPAAAPKAAQKAADDLTLLKGVGPKMAANLKDQGVTSFADIAGWDDAKIDQMDEALGGLPGRIRRDDWVGQAKTLAKG